MTVAALRLAAEPTDEGPIGRITTFLERFSLESTRPSAADIAALRGVLPARTPVYLSAVTGRPAAELIEPARRLRAAGFEPVPHLAVRSIASRRALDDLLSNLAAIAGVRRLLVIGGDRDRASGPFASAIDMIESGRLQRYGISEIGVAGYPDGHPRIAGPVLMRALAAKLEAADQTGLKAHIVTQFCFDAHRVIDWIAQLRDLGIEHPVRIGMAGPASLSKLLQYAQRCGVKASLHGMSRNAGLLKRLVGTSAPDGLIDTLAEAAAVGELGLATPHFFSFGGTAATARWAAAASAGRIVLDRACGFRVDP